MIVEAVMIIVETMVVAEAVGVVINYTNNQFVIS
jgi:hypothetical protein